MRFRDGYDYMFKREEMMYSIPENIPFQINDRVEVPSDGTSDYGEECDDEDEESSNSETRIMTEVEIRRQTRQRKKR